MKDSIKIMDILDNNKFNIIIGSGAVGTIFVEALYNLSIPVEAFVVNDGHKTQEKYLGIDVYELSCFPYNYLDCNFFYAIRSRDSSILNPFLNCFQEQIFFIDCIKDINTLKTIFYKNYLKSRNVDLNNETLQINGLKIANPFFKSDEYLYGWLCEVGDIILPILFNDNSQIDEGAYEYNDVFVDDGDVVFDCGANIGLFSLVSSLKKCEIYAFEPFEKVKDFLIENISFTSNKIHLIEYALSDCNGEAEFKVLDDFIGVNSMLETKMNEGADKSITVKTITIDDFVKENNIKKVDFIKADIEGAERFMLLGATNTLKKYSPKLAICTYHLEDDKEVLQEIILNANPEYVIEHKWKKLFAYVPK